MTPLKIQIIVFILFFVGLVVALIVAARREKTAERRELPAYTKRPSESYRNFNNNPEAKP